MNFSDAIKRMLNDSDGSRVGDHGYLPIRKTLVLSENVRQNLFNQRNFAGRDGAFIYVKLVEEDGTSLYLTGYDGITQFAGFESDKGFGDIDLDRIEKAKIDDQWDSNFTLGHVRHTISEMEHHQVNDLVSRLKKCLTKRSKSRRQSEVKNFVKRFQAACAADKKKEVAESDHKMSASMQRFKNLREANSKIDPEVKELAIKPVAKKPTQPVFDPSKEIDDAKAQSRAPMNLKGKM